MKNSAINCKPEYDRNIKRVLVDFETQNAAFDTETESECLEQIAQVFEQIAKDIRLGRSDPVRSQKCISSLISDFNGNSIGTLKIINPKAKGF